jgi:hypothetical protein
MSDKLGACAALGMDAATQRNIAVTINARIEREWTLILVMVSPVLKKSRTFYPNSHHLSEVKTIDRISLERRLTAVVFDISILLSSPMRRATQHCSEVEGTGVSYFQCHLV